MLRRAVKSKNFEKVATCCNTEAGQYVIWNLTNKVNWKVIDHDNPACMSFYAAAGAG